MIYVLKTNRDSKTENHKDPVDFSNEYLTMKPSGFLYNLDARETSKGIAFFDN